MVKSFLIPLTFFLLTGLTGVSQTTPPQPVGPLPSENQYQFEVSASGYAEVDIITR